MQFIKQGMVFFTVNLFLSAASFSWADDPHSLSSTEPALSTPAQPVQPLDLNLPFKGINSYSQNFADWHVQLNPHYDQPIIIKNKQIQDTVRQHYFGENSVWEQKSGEQIAAQVKAILDFEKSILKYNPDPTNLVLGWDNPVNQNSDTLYDSARITELEALMDLEQFSGSYQYDPSRRAITVQNADTRILPTNQGYYKDNKAVGEGADFDYIQNSATWAGTPVYILGYSKKDKENKTWDLVWTPDCIGWIESDKVATVNDDFISRWKKPALTAIINPEVNIVDEEEGTQRFLGYVGMILPLYKKHHSGLSVLIPIKSATGEAQIRFAYLSAEDAVKIPYSPTPRNFVTVMQHQLGRPFAWGGGRPYGWDKKGFYNDASAEMKYLFTVFGIYLPRHSTDQVDQKNVPGRAVDFTTDATGKVTTVDERIAYLQNNGHPFMTIIGGLALYLGNYENPANGQLQALAYHNIFGITPSQESRDAGKDINRRAVVSKSLILPLLASYPEDSNLSSFIGRGFFRLMYLDDVVPAPMTLIALPHAQPVNEKIDIKALMSL